MRYTVEIDTRSKQGSEALKFLRKFNAGKVIAIHEWRKLKPADVALPIGIQPTEWQWEEYLSRKQGKGKSAVKAFGSIKQRLKSEFGE